MFDRTRERSKKTFRYVKDDVLNAKQVTGVYQDVKGMAKEHLNPFQKKQARTETFANAMERKSLTFDDIEGSYKNYCFRFYLFLTFGSFALTILGWGIWKLEWFVAGPAFAATMICLAQIFNASFRCFQIRHHEFLPVSTWFQRKEEWWPSEYRRPRSRSSKAVSSRQDR